MATELEKELNRRFSAYSGDSLSISKDVYEFIHNAPTKEQATLFMIACKSFSWVQSDHTLSIVDSGITQEEQDSLKDTCGETVNALLKSYLNKAVSESISEDEFYLGLWNNIVNNQLFQDEKEKWFATYYILIDARIPFSKVSKGLTMSNDEYNALIRECKADIQKMKFILSYEFDQRTMEASNLLDIILEQDTYNKKAVLISIILKELRSQRDKLLEFLRESLEENS